MTNRALLAHDLSSVICSLALKEGLPQMNRRTAVILSCSALLACATGLQAQDPQKKTDEIKGDVKAIEGEWTSKDDSGESTWSFKDNKLSLVTPTRKYSVAIKLDPEAKPHKTMDFEVDTDSPNAGGYKAKGIYKLDGDKMTI
jgi:uncharacterized protein (TIGR03067 family)